MTKEYLQNLYGDGVKIEICDDCTGQGSLEIIISRVGNNIQVNLADSAIAASMLSFANEKG